jgi:hypothetical protein
MHSEKSILNMQIFHAEKQRINSDLICYFNVLLYCNKALKRLLNKLDKYKLLFVAQLVEALRYNLEGRGFNSWWCQFLIDRILPTALWP